MTADLQYRDDRWPQTSTVTGTVYQSPGQPPAMPGSTRRHLATAGPLGYAVERQDHAQPLRFYVPDSTREHAASVVLWCRVALALGATTVGFTALTVLFLGLWRLGGWVSG